MSQGKGKTQAPRAQAARAQAPRTRKGIDAPLAWLAGAGLLLSAYLLVAKVLNAKLYCVLGSGCDVVQSSRFAQLFGVPVAGFGLVFYAAILWFAMARMDSANRWGILTPVAVAGAAASVVFTVVQQVILHTTCSLCMISALLTVGILARLIWVRPKSAAHTWVWGGVAAAVAVALIVGGYASSIQHAAANGYAEGLAIHLAKTGAKFYGAYWCSHCQDQKAMFGPAARLLPYIECDPGASNGQPSVCAKAEIRAFPTWEISGQRLEGVLSLEDLARLSGYPSPSQ